MRRLMAIRIGVRLMLVAALCCAAALAAGSRARADAIEYCPLELSAPPQVVSPDQLAVQFESDGPRIVSGSMLVFGAGGWYQADFSAVSLTQTVVHGNDGGILYTRRPYRSSSLYITVPNAGGVLAAFIVQAQATNDPSYGWDQRGMVACDPPYNPEPGPGVSLRGEPIVLEQPQPASLVLKAQHVDAPAGLSLNCAHPFAPPHKTSQANSELETHDLGVRGKFVAYIRVAVNDHGGVDGAWPVVSSGYPEYDQALVLQERRSTFEPARSFCTAVRSYFTTRISMNDNRR
jgi:hypothetical protein